MYTPNIGWVAENALGIWGRFVFYSLLEVWGIKAAQRFLVGWINLGFRMGMFSFVETAGFYNALLLSPRIFPQKYLRAR